MNQPDIHTIITDCLKGKPQSQEALFKMMHNFGMSITYQYTKNLQEAEEVANDGFLKMFKYLKNYRRQIPFKVWLRRIMINCCIDHFRRNEKKKNITNHTIDDDMFFVAPEDKSTLEYKDLVKALRYLSPVYKMVFMLHVIEGYSHKEIGEKLNISKGTSKSNLAKARERLKIIITKQNEIAA